MEYHTKNESFVRYRPVYGSCGLIAAEPCGWIVNTPDGTTMYFGQDDNGYTGNSRVLSDNRQGFKSWSLRKVSDLHHNDYLIKYAIIDGVAYPETIIYNTAGFRNRVVRFTYEARTDIENKYNNGGLEIESRRLQSVAVASNAICVFGYCTDGDLVRKYRLSYKYSATTARSLLTMIREFGTDDVTALPPINFYYSQPNLNTKTDVSQILVGTFKESFGADLNGDGMADLVRFNDNGSSIQVGYQLSNGQAFLPLAGVLNFSFSGWRFSLGDINGDGRKDLVFSKGTSVVYSLWENSGWSPAVSPANPGDPAAIGWSVDVSDLNMDGADDLVYYYNYYDNAAPSCPACPRKIQIDLQFNTLVNSQPVFSARQTIHVDNHVNGQWQLSPANLNSDSALDFILSNTHNGVAVNYILSTGDLAANSGGNAYQTMKNAYSLSDIADNRWMVIPSDYNGDGKTDLIYFKQNYSQYTGDSQMTIGYQPANANGFENYVPYASMTRKGPHSLFPLDINGDNNPEFLLRKYGSDYCDLKYLLIPQVANGPRTFQDYFAYADNSGGTSCKMNLLVGDFNGDGIVDFAHTRFNGSVEDKIFYSFHNTSLVDKMTSMTNGYGMQIAAEYKPLSFFTGAVKLDQGSYCGSDNFDPGGLCGLPFKAGRFLVFKETTSDGRGGNYGKTFSYANGRIKPGRATETKVLGFETFTTTADSPGYYSIQVNRQDGAFARYPAREEWYNGNRQLIRVIESSYDANTGTIFNGTSLVRLQAHTTTRYEAGQYAFTQSNRYTFNDYGQITNVVDIAENTETFDKSYIYAADVNLWILNRVVEQKQTAAGQVIDWTRFVYQNNDKISEQKYLNTSQTWIDRRFQYDAYGNIIAETDPNGNTTKTVYDDIYHCLPVAQVNALGQTTTVEYDALYYHPVRITDPNHNTKGSEFDVLHRITKTIYPGTGNYRQLIYANTGDPNGQFLEIRYNNDSPQGFNYVKHYYDGLMRLYKKAAKGTILQENGQTRFVDIITDYEFYDISDDKHSRESNPYLSNKNNPVYRTYQYDSQARVIKVASPGGAKETIFYGPNFITRQDSRGNTEKVQTDARERDIVRENYEGVRLLSKIAYRYLPLKQASIDADGNSLVEIYDTLGKTVEVNDPATGRWQYRYDKNGNTVEKIDPKGQSIVFTYDALNRILSKQSKVAANAVLVLGNEPGATNNTASNTPNDAPEDDSEDDDTPWSVTYAYDDISLQNSVGRLSHVTDETGKTSFGYDENGNLAKMKKEIEGKTYSFSAKYNTEKKPTQIVYPDGSYITNHYTDAGYLRQVRYHETNDPDPQGHPVTSYLGPNENAELLKISGNGVRDLVSYDIQSFKPLSVVTTAKDSAGADITVRRLNYSMDAYGNIKSIINELEPSFSQHFQTDGLNRITHASGAYGAQNYVYSPGGNLLQKGDKTLYYNDTLHPQSVTSDSLGNHFQYDRNGNTTREYNASTCSHGHESNEKPAVENECHLGEKTHIRNYTYNFENQLQKITGSDGSISEYFYDYSGSRTIKKTRDNTTVYYFHFLSNTSPIYEIQTGNRRHSHNGRPDHERKYSLQTKYIFGSQSELAAQVSSENVNYAALYRQGEIVNYLMASSGNFTGVRGLVSGMTKGYLFASSWLRQGQNNVHTYYVLTLALASLLLLVFVYNAILRYKMYKAMARSDRKTLRRLSPVYYYTLPFLLTAFVWQFGAGCGNFEGNQPVAGMSDNAFWSGLGGDIPDDFLQVSMPGPGPGQTGEGGHHGDSHGGYPVSGAYFFHADHLGSISLVTDAGGRVVTELNYLPYGEIDRAHSYGPDILRYKYTHQEEDRQSGLYNYNARMYNPESARFTTADTQLPGEGKQSQGFNRYMYAMGNPVRYNDPTGHCPQDWICALPGQNFTGPSRRFDNDNFKSPCMTGIDCVSRGHDRAGAFFFNKFGERPESGPSGTVRFLLGNIVKDALWVVAGPFAIIQTDLFFGVQAGLNWSNDLMNKWGWSQEMKNGFAGSILNFLFMSAGVIVTMAADTIMWVIGTVLFAVNITIAALASIAAGLAGFFQGFDDLLSGRKSFEEIWNGFWSDVGQAVDDIGKAIGDFFCGLFGC